MSTKLVSTARLGRFLYQIKTLFLTGVSWDSTNNKIIFTKNGSNTDVVSASTLKSAMGLSNAEENQYAFKTIKVGSTNVVADAKEDTLELTAGDNVTLTPDATNDKVTIAATDTTYESKSAASGGTAVSLVTTGEKYTWNNTVPNTRKVNNKALSADITLTASDVSAIPSTEKGAASGVCPLDSNSKIDSTYLPSYVDDVVEGYPRTGQTELDSGWLATGSASGSAITPETGKIYVLMADSTNYAANSQFRWSGTTYVEIIGGGYTLATDSDIDALFV